MKKFFLVSAVIALASLCSCQKQQSDSEKDAEVERRVQERLPAERQTQQQQQLDQRQVDLDAREKALAEKESAAPTTPGQTEQAESEPNEPESRPHAPRESAITTGHSTFYNKLEPYGDWIETNDYGYVFHPREAASSVRWRPYTDGRWVYTDAGWTWISEEPFGWATYHYGRWTRLRGIGWVWVPGNQWAPAWVSWRKSNDYVGWAPLPPEASFDQRTGIRNWSDSYYDVGPDQYCFVASREFGAPRVEQTLLPPERNVAIINQTTNVTKITYNNRTFVKKAQSYDELRATSREPIQRFRLEQNANVDVSTPPRSQVRGDAVVIAAPVIVPPTANERPPTVKQTITVAAVDLGWAAIANQDEAKRTREKMKSEATPPPNAPPKKFVRAAAPENATPPVTGGGTTSAASTPTAPQTTTPVATSTPKPAMIPRSVVTSSPSPSAPASPTASQRRGRLLVPRGPPTPSVSPASTMTPTPSKRPTAIEEPTLIPAPSAPPGSGQSQQPMGRGKFKSQAQKFNPRKVQPMPSASASATASSAPSPATTSTPSVSPSGNPTKQEKKEQKREERKELKGERKAENAVPSPSVSP